MKKRIIAGLLSFILLTSNSITALATTNVAGTMTGSSAVEDILTLNEVETAEELQEESISDNDIAPDVSSKVENQPVVEESKKESSSDVSTDTENEPEAGTPSVSENSPAQDTDSVSENNPTVSENTLTVSENSIVTDTEILEELKLLVTEAKEALHEIVQKKAIYALVYLTDYYDVKSESNKDADTVATVPSAKTVQILDVEAEWNYIEEWEEYIPTIWYLVQFYDGDALKEGYIEDSYLAYSDELLIAWQNDFTDLFYKASAVSPSGKISLFSTETDYSDVEKFPISYQLYLKELKDKHPNWIFVKMDVGREWEECINEQKGNYSWISNNQPDIYRDEKINGSWSYASEEGIAYYMDPRNFLTERRIFQFEQLIYNATYHTESALQTFLNGTFMKGMIPNDEKNRTYANVIWNSGKSRKLSPFILAARIVQEQGSGNSALISGTYSGSGGIYKGYYNYYNIGASGSSDKAVIESGLKYAKEAGWNTRFLALDEGAAFVGDGYINRGRDTLYLQKFDVEKKLGWLKQYMQNIMAPYTEGLSIQSMYAASNSLDSAFVFKIPVFKNMPGEYSLSPKTLELKKGESKQLKIKCQGKIMSDSDMTSMVNFSSSDESIAVVSERGVVTAVGSGVERTGKATITTIIENEEKDVELKTEVIVTCPLSGISLESEDSQLYYVEGGLPDKVYYLDEAGNTKYYTKADCPTETILTVNYDPDDTTDDRMVTWTIEDENVAIYEALDEYATSIRVTAIGGGSTSITASVKNAANTRKPFTETTEIEVKIPMTDASVETKNLTLYKGESANVAVSYLPLNTTERTATEWKSSNENVVKIQDGMIVATGKGSATVSAAIGPFDGTQKNLQVAVTVKEYEVTFVDDSGNILVTVSGEYGKSLEYLTKPAQGDIPWTIAKDNHYFAGWYTQENGQGNEVTKDTILYSDMTLYPYFIDSTAEDADFYAKPLGDVMYTGSLRKPAVSVYDAGVLLTKGTDYTITYKNNKNVYTGSETEQQPQAVIKGKGKYTGKELTLYFSIIPKEISNIDVSAHNMLTPYSGRMQKMQPNVADGGRTLQKDIDYTLEYTSIKEGAYVEAGTYEVLITGMGNYTGQRKAYITITKLTLIKDVTVEKIADMPFNNGESFDPEIGAQACKPEPEITYQGNTLTKDKDYILVYSDNTEIGTASIIIMGKGDYTGMKTVTFNIVGNDISTVQISGVENAEYTGDSVELKNLEVATKQGQVLSEGKDYLITYQNNINVGKAYVVITGINGYEGTLKKAFQIEPYDIEKNELLYTPDEDGENNLTEPAFRVEYQQDVVYEKGGAQPDVRVYFKDSRLTEGVDYKLEYLHNDAMRDQEPDENEGNDGSVEKDNEQPTLLVIGKNRFSGTYKANFYVGKKDLSAEDSGISFVVDDVKFRNRKGFCFVQPIIRDVNGRRLMEGTDYSEKLTYYYAGNSESEDDTITLTDGTIRYVGDIVSASDISMPGTQIKVVATGIGNYTGIISATYEVLENPSWVDALVEIVEKITNSSKTENDAGEDDETLSMLTNDDEEIGLLSVDAESTSLLSTENTGALPYANVSKTGVSAVLPRQNTTLSKNTQVTVVASNNSYLAMSAEEQEAWRENFESITGYSLNGEIEIPKINLIYVNRLISCTEYPLVVQWVLRE